MIISNQFKEKVVAEAKRLFWIFGYFWILLSLFALHKSIILNEPDPFYHQGFALINALILAKIVYLGEAINLANNLKHKPLIYPTIYKAAIFSCALIASHLLEEVIIRSWHGETIFGPLAAAGSLILQEALAFGLVIFIALIPYFALSEIAERVGGAQLFEAFFVRSALNGPAEIGIDTGMLGRAANSTASEQQERHS